MQLSLRISKRIAFITALIEAIKNPRKIVSRTRSIREYSPPRYYGLAKVNPMKDEEEWYIMPLHWFVRLGMRVDEAWFHFRHQLSTHDQDIIEAYRKGQEEGRAYRMDQIKDLILRNDELRKYIFKREG